MTPLGPAHLVSVSQLTEAIRHQLESNLSEVWVEGEVSNFRRPASGHCYFTLKDQDAQIRAVMWRSVAAGLTFRPQDGMLVHALGTVTVYDARGDLQVMIRTLRPAGEGALQKAFEALKKRLASEGLFDAVHKRPLPPYPEKIGLITSGTGAALQDMLSVLQRRYPQVQVLLCPVRVQGVDAGQEIAEALNAFAALEPSDPFRPDVLIVGRGGGAAEDLWAFNEEAVARALHACPIPVISAVGHETDTTIADFVADVRAATPSMGAALAVPDRRDVQAVVQGQYLRMREGLTRTLALHQQRIAYLIGCHAFNRPRHQLAEAYQRTDALQQRLQSAMGHHLEVVRNQTESLARQLHHLNPSRPLERGYAFVERDGHPVTQGASLRTGDTITLRFQDEARQATIAPE